MSYGGGYGRGYGQQYDYRNSDRQAQGAPGAQAYHGVPPPGPYTGPGGNQYYPQAAPGFPPQTSQVYDPPPRPMVRFFFVFKLLTIFIIFHFFFSLTSER